MNDDNVAGYRDIATGSREAPLPPHGAAQVAPAAMPEIKSLLGLAVAAGVIAALYFAQQVLIPITLAVMLSFVLSPVVDLLQRARLWRAPAVILTVLAALGVIALGGTLIGGQVAGLAADAPAYAQTIEAKIESAQTFAIARVASITKALGRSKAKPTVHPGTTTRPPTPAEEAPIVTTSERHPVLVEVANQSSSPFSVARSILEPVLGPLETTVLVLIVSIFILLQKEDLRDRFIRLFGSTDLHRTTLAMDDAGQRLSRYFLSQLGVNTSFGLVLGLGLWAIGIPSPAMFGILAGLLRFVPYIGTFLAAVAPMALGAAVDPGWSMLIYVGLLFVLVDLLTGYVVEPMLYGHSTGLSPISVIVAAIFWTWIWGPIGLILSTPLTLCLVVMGRHVKSLEFFDVLLGDRPALTPVESFYQRILADNADEALAEAEVLLANRSLLEYYDGVVRTGLKLAAEDEARGTIDRARAAQMTRSMLSIIDDLKEHVGDRPEEVLPNAPAAETGAIVCIAGRGGYDETVAVMLAQLLEQRGERARLVPHDATTREAIAALDLSGAHVLILSYLELSGSPAHLRYLIRRLRQRAPDARIIVGLWGEGEAALHDPDIQRAIGADHHTGSLREALDRTLAIAGASAD